MAATPDDVRDLTGSTLTDPQIQPFVDAAACIMERAAACITRQGVTAACQDRAQAFLAAHLLTLSTVGQSGGSGVKRRETFENYTVEFVVGSYSGSGIMATPYGQAANSITGGCLQEVDKRPLQICFFGGA